MARTAAQRAARTRRRKARNSGGGVARKQPSQRRMVPLVRTPKGKRKRNRAGKSNPQGPRGNNSRGYSGSGPTPYAGRTSTTSTNRLGQWIEEDEYIEDVNGSVGFVTTPIPIQPGLSTGFPWGSRLAQNYEMYEFKECEVYFTSTVSGFAANGQQGTVVLSATYDSADPAPVGLRQVEDSDPHTVPCLPSTSVVALKLDCATMHKGDAKFVRAGPVPNGTDIKTYDAATVFFTTVGCANTSKIGELHIKYKCRLTKPNLDYPEDGVMGHWHGLSVNPTNMFTGVIPLSGNDILFHDWTVQNNSIFFPPGSTGRYMMVWQGSSDGIQAAASVGTLVGCTGVQYWSTPTFINGASSVIVGIGQAASCVLFTFQITSGITGSITFSAGGSTGNCGRDLFISRIPASLVGFEADVVPDRDLLRRQEAAWHVERESLKDRLTRLESLLSPIHVEEDEQKDSDPAPPLKLVLARKGMFSFK